MTILSQWGCQGQASTLPHTDCVKDYSTVRGALCKPALTCVDNLLSELEICYVAWAQFVCRNCGNLTEEWIFLRAMRIAYSWRYSLICRCKKKKKILRTRLWHIPLSPLSKKTILVQKAGASSELLTFQ